MVLRQSLCALPIEVEQRLRALAHLAAVSGYQEITLEQWGNPNTGTGGSEAGGLVVDSGLAVELDPCWQEPMYAAIGAFRGSHECCCQSLRIRLGDAIEVAVEDSAQIGFEIVLESGNTPVVSLNDLNEEELRDPVCAGGIVSAWKRASEVAGALDSSGLLVWACSRLVGIEGLYAAATGNGPVLVRIHASLADEAKEEDMDEVGEMREIARIVSRSVHDCSPDLIDDSLQNLKIKQLQDQGSAHALAALAKEILHQAFGAPSDEVGRVSVTEESDVAMVFVDGHLERVFGWDAHEVYFSKRCVVALDGVTPRRSGSSRSAPDMPANDE